MKKAFVTGAAGFIGSNLVDRLLKDGWAVTGLDNFSTGFREFLVQANQSPSFNLIEGDLLRPDQWRESLQGCDLVFHLAANADVRFGPDHPDRDLQQNTIGTFHVLESMRQTGVSKIVFSSTGSVYGEATEIPTPEDAKFPIQTSLYAASKLAGEGLISAYAESFQFQAWIFRFVSVLGERYSHGHVFDFYRKLQQNPNVLPILGDGEQRKSYIYIQDCLEAILTALEHSQNQVNLFNLGVPDYCRVLESASWIASKLGLSPEMKPLGGDRGWIGDNPFIFLDTKRISALGWKPQCSIREAVEKTVDWLHANPWAFDRRD